MKYFVVDYSERETIPFSDIEDAKKYIGCRWHINSTARDFTVIHNNTTLVFQVATSLSRIVTFK